MDIKHNVNYFKKRDIVKTIGIVCSAIGAIGILLAYSIYIGYLLAMVFLPIGLITFIIGTNIASSESDIDDDIKKALVGVEKELSEDKAYAKRILKNIPAATAEGYDYEEGLMLRKAKNSSVRSSSYTKAMLYPLTDALLISSRTVSLVSIEAKTEFFEIPYTEISSVELVTEEKELGFGKDIFKVKSSRIVVRHSGGLIFSAPFADTMTSQEYVKKLGGFISQHKTVE